MLLASCALWGGVMRLTMDALLPGSAGAVELRALVMLLCFRAARGKYSRDDVRGGIQVGVLFSAGMLCQVSGLRFALPSVLSLLTVLANYFMYRYQPEVTPAIASVGE